MLQEEPRHLFGQAISTYREWLPVWKRLPSLPSRHKYYPARYELIYFPGKKQYRWIMSGFFTDLFYFSKEPAERSGIAIAEDEKLPFIPGLKNRGKPSQLHFDILTPFQE